MAWYDKYVDGTASMGGGGMSPQQALNIRQMEFKQQMEERKELDKYMRKQARKERIRNRPRGSFKSKKKKAHWAWLAELEQKSPQAAAYYRYTQERKGAQKRWKSEQKRRRRAGALQRSAVGDLKKAQWIAKMGGPHAARHKEYHPASMTPVQVGKSGAPQFMSLASMGYKSPAQLGFQTFRPQSYKYSGPGGNPGSTYWKNQPARGEPGAKYVDHGYGADRGTNIQWSAPPKSGYTGMASWKKGGAGGGHTPIPDPPPVSGVGQWKGGPSIITGPASQQQPLRSGGLDFYPAPVTAWHHQEAARRNREAKEALLRLQQAYGGAEVPVQDFDPMTSVAGAAHFDSLMSMIGM